MAREQLKNRIERLLRKTEMPDDEIEKMFEEYSPYKDGWIWNISREEYQDLPYAVDLLIEPKY